MITNTGKSILAKYLVGQAPAYGSYIAVGCGATPLASNGVYGDYSSKTSLDFEMFRVPITSRGYVNENGVSKIVLTAELPTEERYEISEIGVFSAGSNPSAGAYDSKSIYSFVNTENWEYHPVDSSVPSEIPVIYTPLDDRVLNISAATISGTTVTYTTDVAHGYTTGQSISVVEALPIAYNVSNLIILSVPTSKTFTVTVPTAFTSTYISGGYVINDVETGVITQSYPVFQTNADNKTFTNSNRVARYERCRFLNNIVVISGDNSDLTLDSSNRLIVNAGSNHLHLTGTNLDFNRNAPTDELKLAFSVINKDPDPSIVPEGVRILIEFASSDVHGTGEFARFELNIMDEIDNDFATNRYIVSTKQLQELYKSSGFTWNVVDVVKIYACVINNGEPSSDFYVCLDALRLENKSTANPLYGLTGYSVIKNAGAETIIKSANTTNYIEFRFGLDVQ